MGSLNLSSSSSSQILADIQVCRDNNKMNCQLYNLL